MQVGEPFNSIGQSLLIDLGIFSSNALTDRPGSLLQQMEELTAQLL